MSFATDTNLVCNAKIFVETGTFHGDGIYRALNHGFSKVISIEIFEPLYTKAQMTFQKEIGEGKVELFLGDSADVIGEAISKIDEPIMYWFDAHDQTMNDAGVGALKCPIIKELQKIMEVRSLAQRRLDTLMIDDMRLIENISVGWDIDMTEFYKTIWQFNPDFRLARERGFIDHDIIRCDYKYLK
jgi:hypothetical protein